MKKVAISQSNYIPWKGYFDSISACDVFVLYDNVQYTKRDWRNRNRIMFNSNLKWLSIPVDVKGKYLQKISETKVADKSWNLKHLKLISQAYAKTSFFKEKKEWLENLYQNCTFDYLSEINYYFITEINKLLGIKTKVIFDTEFELSGDKSQKLLDICKELNADEYYSGPAAQSYLNEELFKKQGVQVKYWDYSGYKSYNQLSDEFEHGVSVFDLIFCEGVEATKYMKFL
jgi:hypothetical protein